MINYIEGDLFQSSASVLVNTVNCVGAMGKGIALQFKHRFPKMFVDYQQRCEAEEISPGKLTVFVEDRKTIINFPTKRHWREKSRLRDIGLGLIALKELIKEKEISHLAMPALGCGNGGLAWTDVKRAIEYHLGGLINVQIDVYLQTSSKRTDRLCLL